MRLFFSFETINVSLLLFISRGKLWQLGHTHGILELAQENKISLNPKANACEKDYIQRLLEVLRTIHAWAYFSSSYTWRLTRLRFIEKREKWRKHDARSKVVTVWTQVASSIIPRGEEYQRKTSSSPLL